ncbi:hypothetical protein LSH36_165g00005 [Paralvinella palmiformis]|uniref:Uncharacterized protein n=1 Tax=Paralvinella palmiformis TaxID=53620 RepID=A0AAD9JSP0_9ANNE|nr:hypothetical protein LSH36_165g00005 [Paralvinella palmiformis]
MPDPVANKRGDQEFIFYNSELYYNRTGCHNYVYHRGVCHTKFGDGPSRDADIDSVIPPANHQLRVFLNLKIELQMDEYFTGEINETMERFNFNKRNQAMDENVDNYVTCPRTLAKTCNFCDNCGDSLIRDRIIMGIIYEGYENSQADLLKVGKLTLKECINICRSAEAIKRHMKLMSSIVKEDIHKVSVRSKYNPKRPVNDRGKHQKYSAKGTMSRCKLCGQEHGLRNLNVLHGELSARNVTIETILLLYARIATIN